MTSLYRPGTLGVLIEKAGRQGPNTCWKRAGAGSLMARPAEVSQRIQRRLESRTITGRSTGNRPVIQLSAGTGDVGSLEVQPDTTSDIEAAGNRPSSVLARKIVHDPRCSRRCRPGNVRIQGLDSR